MREDRRRSAGRLHPQLSLIPTRVCVRCGDEKPLEEFRRNSRHRTGYDNVCVICNRAIVRAWQKANPEKRAATLRKWRSDPDNLERARADSRARYAADPKIREQKRQWQRENAEKRKEIVRRSDEKNRDKRRAYNRARRAQERVQRREQLRRWKAENREWVAEQNRVRRSATPETVEYGALILRDPCCYCGGRDRMELDHIEPIKDGGVNDWTNLTVACKRCNRRKSSRSLLVWMLDR